MLRFGTSFLMLILLTLLTEVNGQSLVKADSILAKRGEVCFSFECNDKQQLRKIGRIISIDKIKGEMVFAYANRKEFSDFTALNIPWMLQPHSTDLAKGIVMCDQAMVKATGAWDAYPTYSAYLAMMKEFQTNYPNLCRIDTILSATPNGRKILVAKITHNVNVAADKPLFLYTSSMHGDEITGYVLMLRLIDYLLSNYATDARVANLVDNVEIWINPLANPDGTYKGGDNSVTGATRNNANYVDLNRNYPDPWTGPHPDGQIWQPETQAFMDFASAHQFVMSANFHGGAELANYPWDYYTTAERPQPDAEWWINVAKEYVDTCKRAASNNGYFTELAYSGAYPGVTEGADWYSVEGGRQDYMNYWHHCREMTLEISSTKLLPAAQLPAYWNYNYLSLLNYIQQASYGFRGIITDSITSQPIRAKVSVVGHDADSTDVYSALPTGNYHRPIKAGSWTLKFEAPGYCPKTVSDLTVLDKQTLRVDVQLSPCQLGVENGEKISPFVVYPNPSQGVVFVRSESQQSLSISLLDMTGKVLYCYQSQGEREVELDVTMISNGIYWLKIQPRDGFGDFQAGGQVLKVAILK